MSLRLFTRSLNRCGQEISILERDLIEGGYGDIQPTETFTEIDTPLAIVKTVGSGDKLFDSIQVAEGATHVFCVLYSLTLDPVEHHNFFIDLKAERYKILAVTNIDEKDQVLALQATKRGDSTLEAAQA